jgi:hypothetical protein
LQDAASEAEGEQQGDRAELLIPACDEPTSPRIATKDASTGAVGDHDGPISTGATLQQVDDWQQQLVLLQEQLQSLMQSSSATSAEQLQEVCQTLLHLSTQLQRGQRGQQDRLASSGACSRDDVLLVQTTPTGRAMRRWSNPVFSTSAREHPVDPSMQLMTSVRPMISSTGLTPAGSTAHSNPTYQEEDMDLRRCSSNDDELPVWVDMPEALAASAAEAAAGDSAGAAATAAADSDAVTAGPVSAAVSSTVAGSDNSRLCCGEQQPQLVAVGPVSVFQENCTVDEALTPQNMSQLPLPGDRLPPCELQDCCNFVPMLPAAAVSAQALEELMLAQKKGLQPDAVNAGLRTQVPAAADSKAAIKAALAPDFGSMGASVHVAGVDSQSLPSGYSTVGDAFSGLTKQQPIKPATAQHMQEHGSSAHKPSLQLLGTGAFSDALQQLLLAVQHAGAVGPAAVAALQSCNESLAAADLAVLHSAASSGMQDAGCVQDTLLELATTLQHMLAPQQPEDAGAAAASVAQQRSQHAGVAAAETGVAGVPWRQDTHQSWTIAAVHEGNRWSFSSHGSGSHHLDATASPWLTSGGGAAEQHQQLTLGFSQGGDVLQPETVAVSGADPPGVGPSACGSGAGVQAPASAAGAAAEQPHGVGSQGPLPSLDLFEAVEASGSLLDEGSSMFFARGDAAAAKVAVAEPKLEATDPAVQCAAAAATGLDTADQAEAAAPAPLADGCRQEFQTRVAELPVQHSITESSTGFSPAAVAPQLSLSRRDRPQSAPGAVQASACASSPGGLLYNTITEVSPREHSLSCIPPGLNFAVHMRKAVKGFKKQLHHTHSHAGRPTEDHVDSMGSQSAEEALQQQVLLVWSLRDQLTAAERKLQEHQEQHEHSYHTSPLASRHARAATVDEVLIRPTQLAHSSNTAAATADARVGSTAWRNTCDTAVLARPRSTSPGPIASVQHAFRHFLAVTSHPGSPAKVVGFVRPDGRICIEPAPAASTAAAAADASGSLQHSTTSDTPSQVVDKAGPPENTAAGPGAPLNGVSVSTAHCVSDCGQVGAVKQGADGTAECFEPQSASKQPQAQQQADSQLLQELQNVQQQRHEAEALHAAVQQESEATKQQLHVAAQQVLQLQEQLSQMQQQLADAQAAKMVLEVRHLQDSKREASAVVDECRKLEAAFAGAQDARAALSQQLQDAREHLNQQKQAASELQEQLLTAQQQQWAAEDACAQMQAQQERYQGQLLQVQQHEKELVQQLQDMQAAAVVAQQAAANSAVQEQQACSDNGSQHHSIPAAQDAAAEAAGLQAATDVCDSADEEDTLSAVAAECPAPDAAMPTTQGNAQEPEQPVPHAQTAACLDSSGESQAKYNEQVIQQLAAEVDRLFEAQAATESPHSHLDAATERNMALQAEVDSLTAALALAHQRADAAEAARAAPAANASAYLEKIHLQEQLEQEHMHAEHEHAMAAVLQQQLERSSADAASAHSRAAELQAELQALQECNTELKAQLQQVTATLAELEATTSRPESYAWPPTHDGPAISQHTPQQEPAKHEQSAAASTEVVDGAVHAALERSLSDALNKQTELQELLQQRDKQLQALTAQLCSSNAAAAGTPLQSTVLALGLPTALLQGGQETEHTGSILAAQQAGSSAGQYSTLAAEVAALLARSPPRGCTGAAGHALCDRASNGTASQDDDSAASSTAEAVDEHHGDSAAADNPSSMRAVSEEPISSDGCEGCGSGCSSWCSEDGPRQHSASGPSGRHASHLPAGSVQRHTRPDEAHYAASKGAAADRVGVSTQQHSDGSGLVTWGSEEGRLTPLARQSGSITQPRPANPIPELADLQAVCAVQVSSSLRPSAEQQMLHIDSVDKAAAANDKLQASSAIHAAAWVAQDASPAAPSGGAGSSSIGCAESEACHHQMLCRTSSAGADHWSVSHSMAASTVVLGGGSDALELPPSTEVSRMPEMSLEIPVAADSAQHQHRPWQQDGAELLLEQGTQSLGLQEAATRQGHVSSATAAAVATHLLAAARAAAARATAAEAQQQQAAEELALQHDLQELQHRELTLLKQRLAAAEAEAAGLGTRLQAKHQQLQQVQLKLRKLQQQQELQAQEVPTPNHQLFGRTGGYASAAAAPTPAAVARAVVTPTAQSKNTKQNRSNLSTPGTRNRAAAGPAAAGPHAAQFATSFFEVGSAECSPHTAAAGAASGTAARTAHQDPANAPSNCHAEQHGDDPAASCPQPAHSSSPRPKTSCGKHAAAGPGASSRGLLTASSPAAASSPAHAHKQGSQAGSPAAQRGESPAGMTRSPYRGSASLSWSAEIPSPGGAAAQGQDPAYLHAEEVGNKHAVPEREAGC